MALAMSLSLPSTEKAIMPEAGRNSLVTRRLTDVPFTARFPHKAKRSL